MLTAYRWLLEMMSPGERHRFWMLVAITFVLTLLEVGSVISILPFLRLLSDPGLIETTPILNWLYTAGGFETDRSFLIWVGLGVFTITVAGLALKMITIWLTTRFALMRSYSFSAKLLTGYLHQPYEWFLSRHSSDLGSAILAEVDKVVVEALLPAMRIIPETFTILLLIGALCLMEPQIALGGAVLLGGFYSLVFIAVRRVMTRIGKTRLAMNKTRFHVVQEAMGGVKELKIMGLEQGFLGRFRAAAYLMARVQTRGQVIMTIPRYALEGIAFGGMILLILVLMLRGGGDLVGLVPTLGLIAAVGLRLIPALQQLYQRATSLRQSLVTLERIHADMTGLDHEPVSDRERRAARQAIPLKHQLQLSDIRYSYPDTDRPALAGLNMTINANTTVGIVGSTGAGKTTLIDIVLGLLDPAQGTMQVDDTEITPETRRAWQKSLAYVPQTIFLSDGSIAENIAYGVAKENIDMAAVERASKIAALHDFVMTEMEAGYETMVGERGVRLSGGQRQRIGIARALYNDPALLVLDEATSALDTLTEAAVMEAVHNIAGKMTIIMIAHRLSTVRECDEIFMLRGGKVAASGRFDALVQADDEFRQMATGVADTA